MESSNKKYIYIIEDDLAIRSLLIELLESEGYQVGSAGNGQEAIDFLSQSKKLPALILVDLAMPIKGGLQFRKEQKALENLATIPTIMMSASGDEGRSIAESEMSGFLTKPIDLNLFLETIGAHLP